MSRIISCWFFAALLLARSADSSASTLYTIDVSQDILATIDTGTGAVGEIDPTPFGPFQLAFIAYHGSLLYEVNRPAACDGGVRARMNLIDPSGPSVTFSQFITLGGDEIDSTIIGDLTSDGTHVYITLRPPGVCSSPLSLLATLSASAELTIVADLSGVGADMNMLAASGTGQLYALDQRPFAGEADLYLVTPPATYQFIGTHSMTAGGNYAGMTFDPSGELWVLERTAEVTGFIRRLDPTTGQALELVPLSRQIGLSGLAASDLATPTIVESWGRLKTIYR